MDKLPISIGILSWHSGQVLVDTLTTYHSNGLFDMVNDVTILFQEITPQDIQIATHFGLNFIGLQKNIGIGQAFIKLTENAESDYVLILEHDWNLIEDKETTYNTLKRSVSANNTPTNQPSAGSGVPQSSTPTSVPAASEPPPSTANLGKTPLDANGVKSASDEELDARLRENKKQQENVIAIYQSAISPRTGETPAEFDDRKDALERQLSTLDKESKAIKKEKKSRQG